MEANLARADDRIVEINVAYCEGFRMPAHGDGTAHTGAGVRKPSREETAGRFSDAGPRRRHRAHRGRRTQTFKGGNRGKLFGCRPTETAPRTPGPAYANLQGRKPREGFRMPAHGDGTAHTGAGVRKPS